MHNLISQKHCIWALFLIFSFPVSAQTGPNRSVQPQQDQARLPWNRDLRIAPVKSLEPLEVGESRIFVEHAGVPCVIRDTKVKGRLVAVFQWFPMEEAKKAAFDQIAMSLSDDDGRTWKAPTPIQVAGLDPERYQRPFDPAIVQLADGRYRLYFTSSDRAARGVHPQDQGAQRQDAPEGSGTDSKQAFRGSGARVQEGFVPPGERPGRLSPSVRPPMRPGSPGIYSALSQDLKTFTFEEGKRSTQSPSAIVDATVVQHGATYFMIAHPEMRHESPFDIRQGYFAVSSDGLTFERKPNLGVAIPGDFIGNLFSHQGRLHFLGGGPAGIWSMSSKDGLDWGKPSISKTQGGDPSVFADGAGKLWLVHVGEVRKDASAAPSWARRPARPESTAEFPVRKPSPE